jgi:hypothetical protein
VAREAAGDVYRFAPPADVTRGGDLVVDDRRDRAGPIAELQAQELRARRAPANLDVTDQEDLRDIETFRKIPDFHDAAER